MSIEIVDDGDVNLNDEGIARRHLVSSLKEEPKEKAAE